jgi:hypothetical protein
VIIGSIAVARSLEVVAGPGGVERALSNAPNGTVSGGLVAACAVATGEAAVLAYAARARARWRG